MSTEKPAPCYREAMNGVYFTRKAHRPDCVDSECRGCVKCVGRHCTARTNCTWHIDASELTCGRCIAAVRRDLGWIGDLSALMLTQAMADGLESQAANLAGPTAYYPKFSARRRIAKRWIEARIPFERWEQAQAALLDDDDEHHPGVVLTRWEAMLREDYRHTTTAITLRTSLAYLDRTLHRVAHDDAQDFPLLRSELKKCRQHLEAVLHNDTNRDRGAPCPTCLTALRVKRDELRALGVPESEWPKLRTARLQRHYAHWCDDEACEKFHFTDEVSDVWRCPKDAKHWWTQKGYADEVMAGRGA